MSNLVVTACHFDLKSVKTYDFSVRGHKKLKKKLSTFYAMSTLDIVCIHWLNTKFCSFSNRKVTKTNLIDWIEIFFIRKSHLICGTCKVNFNLNKKCIWCCCWPLNPVMCMQMLVHFACRIQWTSLTNWIQHVIEIITIKALVHKIANIFVGLSLFSNQIDTHISTNDNFVLIWIRFFLNRL